MFCFVEVTDPVDEWVAGVRHPEELSFAKPLEGDDLRYNYREREAAAASSSAKKKSSAAAPVLVDTNTFIAHHSANSTHSSTNSLDVKGAQGCTPVVPHHSHRSAAHHANTTPISSPVRRLHSFFLFLPFFYWSVYRSGKTRYRGDAAQRKPWKARKTLKLRFQKSAEKANRSFFLLHVTLEGVKFNQLEPWLQFVSVQIVHRRPFCFSFCFFLFSLIFVLIEVESSETVVDLVQ